MLICEPTGNATDEFNGTVRVFAEPTPISTTLFLSARTSVYEAVWAFVETSANLPRSIAAVAEISAFTITPEAMAVTPVSEMVISPVSVTDVGTPEEL